MNGPTVLLFVFVIAGLFAIAVVITNTSLDARRQDHETRRAIEAERRKAAALRGPRVLR